MKYKDFAQFHTLETKVLTNKKNIFSGFTLVDFETDSVDIDDIETGITVGIPFDEIASIEIIEDKDAIDEA